jgi:hypothetical protein
MTKMPEENVHRNLVSRPIDIAVRALSEPVTFRRTRFLAHLEVRLGGNSGI